MNIRVDISGGSGLLAKAASLIKNRRGLHEASITEVQHVTELHLQRLANSKHDTANRLGAAPSNHLAQAADKVARAGAVSASDDSGTLTINHPGMGRAFHDVTITPKNAKALAIPVNALAYAHRPREIWEKYNLFIARTKSGRGVIFRPTPGGKPVAMFVLVRSVTQKQDRSLLPSDDEFSGAASIGARRFIRTALGI